MPLALAIRLKTFLASRHFRQNGLGLLFANRRGHPFSANKRREKKLRPLLSSLGIQLAGFHAFRHGVATTLIDRVRASLPWERSYVTVTLESPLGCTPTSFLNRSVTPNAPA